MRYLPCTLAALALLGACSGGEKSSAPAPSGNEAPTDTATAAGSSAPAPRPAAIPAALHGRWGLVAADCEAGRADAKGLLTIDAASLKFYESVGKLGEIADAGDSFIRATFAFTGEGQSWTQDQSLETGADGTQLVRMEMGANASPTPFTYTRCK